MIKCTKQNILKKLRKIFPNPTTELIYNSNFELLVAVILSAQCTDKRVNECTKVLFQKYNTPQEFAKIDVLELEKLIYSCGFYHNKAKNIIKMSKQLVEDFGGVVPNNLENLQKLSGVGRKTANVVYSIAFKGDAIAVDTHVFRVANRLSISKSKNVLDCEKDLMKFFDKNSWSEIHFLLVLFGRYICKSRNPECEKCPFNDICTYKNKKC